MSKEFKVPFNTGDATRYVVGHMAREAVRRMRPGKRHRTFDEPRRRRRRRRRVGYGPTVRSRPRNSVKLNKKKKYKGPLTKEIVKAKIRKICTFIKEQEALHVRRERAVGSRTAAVGKTELFEFAPGGTKAIIEAACQNLRFYDPNTDALVTRDLANGTYSRHCNMSIFRKLCLTNNYGVPCKVEIYSCVPVDDTNNGVITYMTNVIVGGDQGTGLALNSNLLYPSDFEDVKQAWKMKRVVNKVLNPGSTVCAIANSENVKYEFGYADAHGQAYQKDHGGHLFLLRLTGHIGHDAAGLNQWSNLQCGVDYVVDTTFRIKYDAGKDLHDLSYSDASATGFTNIGVCSQKPITDNQSYSVA